MPVAQCPDCDADVDLLPLAEVGETVDCDECGGELEVASLDPVELKLIEDELFDDDEDDEDDEW